MKYGRDEDEWIALTAVATGSLASDLGQLARQTTEAERDAFWTQQVRDIYDLHARDSH